MYMKYYCLKYINVHSSVLINIATLIKSTNMVFWTQVLTSQKL